MYWYLVEFVNKSGSREQRTFKADTLKQAREKGNRIAETNGGTEPAVKKW